MDARPPAPATPSEARSLKAEGADRFARREEARRCLLGVVEPAFRELRAAFQRGGGHARVGRAGGADPTEATILVADPGQPEVACVVRVAIAPERGIVTKRWTIPDPVPPALPWTEERSLLDGPEEWSDARSVTRADVVHSVAADYSELKQLLSRR